MQNSLQKPITVVWLKRDLRLSDHYPLYEASQLCATGQPAIALYCLESGYWQSNKASDAQKERVMQSLVDFQKRFAETCGGVLTVLVRTSAEEAIGELLEKYQVREILTHQETGNSWTYERDQRVNTLTRNAGVPIREWCQNGVQRAKEPTDWTNHWIQWVDTEQALIPTCWKTPNQLIPSELPPSDPNNTQATRNEAEALLISFLQSRCLIGSGYRGEMANPEFAFQVCSRISGHLAWGSISTRTAHQGARRFIARLQGDDPRKSQIQSFLTRLAWRDGFIQRFEAMEWMEHRCINPAMENVRNDNPENLERFLTGNTGYPYIDACMRSLNTTGWLTFRARALIVSFAAYALNLDWRAFGPHLARTFIDYEPGIHYNQLQMNAGTTLASAPQIYNPLKQSIEHDRDGNFIRQWLPEIAAENASNIHLPTDHARHSYPSAIVPPGDLWKIMRANAPRKPRGPTPQLEFKWT